jgi:hypothetical protein
MEETPIGKRAEVTKDGVLIVTIVMGEAGAGIVMEVTDMADAVARIVAIVVMMGMIVLSAGVVATAIVIVANDRAEIDMEEGAIAIVVVIVRVVIASAKVAAIVIGRRIAGGEVPRQVAAAAVEGETASAAIIPDLISAVGISCLPKQEDQTDRIRMREG